MFWFGKLTIQSIGPANINYVLWICIRSSEVLSCIRIERKKEIDMTFKLFGKEVHNPILVVMLVLVTIILGFVALLFSPVLVPMHFILRRKGLNGFYFDNCIVIERESFKEYLPHPTSFLGFGLRRL